MSNDDDIINTIAQYDVDDDFPEYANEQNKELNQIVSASLKNSRQNILGTRESEVGGTVGC